MIDTPGPGAYGDNDAPLAPGGPAFSFPRAPSAIVRASADATPAPGDHAAGDQAISGPAFTVPLSARTVDATAATRELNPGPGFYEAANPARGPAFSVPRAETATADVGASTVGPGAYDLPGVANGPAFTLAGRCLHGYLWCKLSRLPCTYPHAVLHAACHVCVRPSLEAGSFTCVSACATPLQALLALQGASPCILCMRPACAGHFEARHAAAARAGMAIWRRQGMQRPLPPRAPAHKRTVPSHQRAGLPLRFPQLRSAWM